MSPAHLSFAALSHLAEMSAQANLPLLPLLKEASKLLPNPSRPSDQEWTEEGLNIPEGTLRRKAIINTVHEIWRLRNIEEDVEAKNKPVWHRHLAYWLVSTQMA